MNEQLNLARKWRPKKFDDIVGQDLIVNLLKNSLYRNLIFPVYLFSGPKGSGKTSTARLFASALNCLQLKSFIENPKSISLPCLICISCTSMLKSAHPDFIEIDAASNTGVENIRQIIENASFSPVLSNKKIYLIDEAHMLSKSAFNAFLKILEEPPKSAIFMLATTDILKIIPTIKSRCFQLFFDPINQVKIANQLELICAQENINCSKEAFSLIASYSEGSLRDALNILEKLRLNNLDKIIDKESVFESLGFVNSEKLIELLNIILDQNLSNLINFLKLINFSNYNVLNTWKGFVDLVYKLFLIKNNVNIDLNLDKELINNILNKTSAVKLLEILEICNFYEFNIVKSSMPQLNLELMFIKLLNKDEKKSFIKAEHLAIDNLNKKLINQDLESNNFNNKILNFLKAIDNLNDPLLSSIFGQSKIDFNENLSQLNLIFLKDFIFFQEFIEEKKSLWMAIVNKFFGLNTIVNISFSDSQKYIKENAVSNNIFNNTKETNLIKNSTIKSRVDIDIADHEKWPIVNKILKIFPGKINWQ